MRLVTATGVQRGGVSAAAETCPIPVLRPHLPQASQLLPYLLQIDCRRIYSNHGPLVLELERRLTQSLSIPSGGIVTAASGTAALVGAILASAGRATPRRPLAIVPAFTFIGTASAVEQCGYQICLADVDAESWTLEIQQVARCPKLERVGLVVPVAPFGRPVPQAPWQAFRRRTNIPVVIDGAASLEGLVDNAQRFTGEVPVALSFHATKSFGTGEGGGIACSDPNLLARATQALNFGFQEDRNSHVSSINGKMSEYHAAVGLAELDGWAVKRLALRTLADRYRQLLRETMSGSRFFAAPDLSSCYAIFRCGDVPEAERIQAGLRRNRIDFRLWYGRGLHHHPYAAGFWRDDLRTTETLAPTLLGLPVAADLRAADLARVVAVLAASARAAPSGTAEHAAEPAP